MIDCTGNKRSSCNGKVLQSRTYSQGGEVFEVKQLGTLTGGRGAKETSWVDRDCAAVLTCRIVDQAPFLVLDLEVSKRICDTMCEFISECARRFAGVVEGWMLLVDGFLIYGAQIERDTWISIAESAEEAMNLAVRKIIPEGSGLGFSVALAEASLSCLGAPLMPRAMAMGRYQLDMQEIHGCLEIGQIAVQATFLPCSHRYRHTFSTSGGLVFLSTCERMPTALEDERYNYRTKLYYLGREPLRFARKEIRRLKGSLDSLLEDIQVIGSIGLPGVKTKRTIDLMAKVLNTDDRRIRERLYSLGYVEVLLKSPLLSTRKFFRKSHKGGGYLGCNLHILNESDWRNSRERAMRASLQSNSELASLYSSAKDYLATATRGCAYHYGLRKDRFLKWLEGDLVRGCCHYGEREEG